MRVPLRRDVMAGAAAGLLGGLVFDWALAGQGMMAAVSGLLGSQSLGVGVLVQLVLAMLLGAGFGAVVRYQAGSYAATLSSGLLWGLVWWTIGPLTLTPIFLGHAPGWSLAEASAAFPDLIGNLLYGGVTALSFYLLVTLSLRLHPEMAAAPAVVDQPKRRIVILGGGFGGVSAAQRLEHLLVRDPSVEITLVSQSNYLLFTPMLAEVASSGLEDSTSSRRHSPTTSGGGSSSSGASTWMSTTSWRRPSRASRPCW